MDILKLVPIIRGAYLDAGCLAFVLSGDSDNGISKLPELSLPSLKALLSTGAAADPGASENALSPADLSVLGKEARASLSGLRNGDGSFPSALRVEGLGDFFAAETLAEAERLKKGTGADTRILPRADSNRNDVVRGRVSLVTGGAQGFGAEIVRGLVDAGSFVFIADINKDGAEAFASRFNKDGRKRAAAIFRRRPSPTRFRRACAWRIWATWAVR